MRGKREQGKHDVLPVWTGSAGIEAVRYLGHVTLFDEFDTIEVTDAEFDDLVAWVGAQRAAHAKPGKAAAKPKPPPAGHGYASAWPGRWGERRARSGHDVPRDGDNAGARASVDGGPARKPV
jgi:hypothetical protein